MPIYEYLCSNCQHKFDLLQKLNDLPVSLCPNCQQNTVKRLVSAAGFQLKGTGWYETDFKNKPKQEKKGNQNTKDPTGSNLEANKDAAKDAAKDSKTDSVKSEKTEKKNAATKTTS